MRAIVQKTIQDNISTVGIGLHSGAKVRMTIKPADEGAGILFARTDLDSRMTIKACLENVVDTSRATTLGANGASVSTVEHLLSACAGLGVDNVLVELDGPELPIMDGSASPFVYLLRSAGLVKQLAPRRFMILTEQTAVTQDEKFVSISPAPQTTIEYSIEYDHPLIKSQSRRFNLSETVYDEEISRARTYGFLHEVEYLKKMGLAQGGTFENSLVLDNFRVLNKNGFRYHDEPVRHKTLDLMGDFMLLGGPIIGRVRAHKSGHGLNYAMMQHLAGKPGLLDVVEFKSPGDYIDFLDASRLSQARAA